MLEDSGASHCVQNEQWKTLGRVLCVERTMEDPWVFWMRGCCACAVGSNQLMRSTWMCVGYGF